MLSLTGDALESFDGVRERENESGIERKRGKRKGVGSGARPKEKEDVARA